MSWAGTVSLLQVKGVLNNMTFHLTSLGPVYNLPINQQQESTMTEGKARSVIHEHAQFGGHSPRKVKEAIQVLKMAKILPSKILTAETAHTFIMGI